ncbi:MULTISPECIES: hypothetical protein [unclassified Sphingomonas]|uniref:hypothetical protein n=1 Tax=unclassified Sphingomonas TaxID=196159 RepID=UPI00226B1566|nr:MULTISPECIES: hypothetical protein [unclassified Sphingomonas]
MPKLNRDPSSQPLSVMSKLLRSFTSIRLLVAIVIAPTLAFAGYVLWVQTPFYACEFRVVVHNAQEGSSQSLPQLPGIGLPAANSADSYAIIQYLESGAGVANLDKKVDLRHIFSSPDIDPTSRLSANATNEQLTRYWRNMLDAYYENTTNTVVVRVKAFTPKSALVLSQAALVVSEQLINGMTERSRRDLLDYSRKNAADAASSLRQINVKLQTLRNQRGLIDPQLVARANLEQQSGIQEELVKATSELAMRARYSPGSPALPALRTRIASMRAALLALQGQSTGNMAGKSSISGALNAFEQLQVDQDFAQKRYEQALATQEKLRAQAAQQQLYLDMIFGPSLPEEPDGPRIALSLGVFLAFAIGFWVIASLVLKSYRERV